MQHILVIQTAFIGDVVLALPVAQALHARYPNAQIHMLVRRGNEGLLTGHPAVHKVWVWDKKQGKLKNLFGLIRQLRHYHFDLAVNLHRFASSGLVMAGIRAAQKVGFNKNPLSIFYTQRYPHTLGSKGDATYLHEVQRNRSLVQPHVGDALLRPTLHPSAADHAKAKTIAGPQPYVVIAPASVWHTKQWPAAQWNAMINLLPVELQVFLVGAPSDKDFCAEVAQGTAATNLAGQLSFLETAALMAGARRVFANDSAPLHLASAVNAPTTAVFCSTIPEFGFGPLADDRVVLQVGPALACRPCGLHGHRACPQGHFRCAYEISPAAVAATVQ